MSSMKRMKHSFSSILWQRSQEYTMGKGQSLQQMVLGKLDSHMQKNENGPLSYTVYENELEMD